MKKMPKMGTILLKALPQNVFVEPFITFRQHCGCVGDKMRCNMLW